MKSQSHVRGYSTLPKPMSASRDEVLQVIMDSNALFAPLQFKIDILSELERVLNRRFELILLSSVRHELETLVVQGSPKTQRMAAFALKFAEKCRYVEVESAGTVDDAIVESASRWKMPVFTNDSQLRKRLRDISVPVIYVRQKSHLEIEGMIQSHV